MVFDVRRTDLVTLNSLTKYPSIPTYHALDPKGGNLGEEVIRFEGRVIATEKVDGTNARIVCLPDGTYLLGSREEFLYAKGDLIGNPALGIAATFKAEAERLSRKGSDGIRVYFFELYGGKVTAASKQYTGKGRVGYRLFDVALVSDYERLLAQPAAELSAWRENGGQSFADEETLRRIADQNGLMLTPRLDEFDAAALPLTIEATLEFLRGSIVETHCALDQCAHGKPEGIVIRTPTRSTIAKIRFADYERTLKKRR